MSKRILGKPFISPRHGSFIQSYSGINIASKGYLRRIGTGFDSLVPVQTGFACRRGLLRLEQSRNENERPKNAHIDH